MSRSECCLGKGEGYARGPRAAEAQLGMGPGVPLTGSQTVGTVGTPARGGVPTILPGAPDRIRTAPDGGPSIGELCAGEE